MHWAREGQSSTTVVQSSRESMEKCSIPMWMWEMAQMDFWSSTRALQIKKNRHTRGWQHYSPRKSLCKGRVCVILEARRKKHEGKILLQRCADQHIWGCRLGEKYTSGSLWNQLTGVLQPGKAAALCHQSWCSLWLVWGLPGWEVLEQDTSEHEVSTNAIIMYVQGHGHAKIAFRCLGAPNCMYLIRENKCLNIITYLRSMVVQI